MFLSDIKYRTTAADDQVILINLVICDHHKRTFQYRTLANISQSNSTMYYFQLEIHQPLVKLKAECWLEHWTAVSFCYY